MPLTEIIATKQVITMKCCKGLTISYPTAHAYGVQTVVTGFGVSLAYQPTRSVTLMFNITRSGSGLMSTSSSVSCLAGIFSNGILVNSSGVAFVTPDKIAFSNTSLTTSTFTFYANTGGCYRVAPYLIGPSAYEYNITYVNTPSTFVISTTAATLPAPLLTSAVFSSDGRSVTISFNQDTDKALYVLSGAINFKCNILFVIQNGSDSTSSCIWSSASTVIMTPSQLVTSGTSIQLRSRVLKASCPAIFSGTCDQLQYAPSLAVVVGPPSTVLAPLILVPPQYLLGACDSLVIDLNGCQNSGGRPWTMVQLSLVSSTDVDVTSLITYLGGTDFSTLITLPRSLLNPDNTYVFQISLTNFLGATSSATTRAVVVDTIIPQVSISGPASVTTVRRLQLALSASGSVTQCDGSSSSVGLSYVWTVTQSSQLTNVVSISKDPKKFIVAAYSLTAASTYVFTVTVSISAKTSSASVTVNVGLGGVVALIAGGGSISKRASSTITLDASSSINYDVAGITGERAGLSFSWGCIEYSPSYGGKCPSVLNSAYNREMITFPGPFTKAGVVYLATVMVTSGTLSSSASTYVSIGNDSAPLVSVYSDQLLVLASKKLTIVGIVNSTLPVLSKWYLNGNASLLNGLTSAQSSANGVITSITLVLPANSLSPGGTYTFKLVSTTLTGSTGFSSLTVNVNLPPTPGFFSVTPSTGRFAETVFVMAATYWTTSALSYPLKYQFGYTDKLGTNNTLQSQSTAATLSTKLPIGSIDSNYVLSVYVYVLDTYGTQASATTVTTVLPAVQNATAVATALDEFFRIAHAVQSSDDLLGLSNIVSDYYNSVNCSGAPACSSLNRGNCDLMAHTCGACLRGYAGPPGPGNTTCLSVKALKNLGGVGSSCKSDSDCAFGYCSSGSCSSPLRTCTNNCSFRGTCKFFSEATDQLISGGCTVDDRTCYAKCLCNQNFKGSYCQLDSVAFSIRSQQRKECLIAAENSSTLSVVTTDGVSSYINSVNSISAHPDELFQISGDLGDEASLLALNCFQARCDYSTSSNLLTTVGNALSAFKTSSEYGSAIRYGRRLQTGATVAAVSNGIAISDAVANVAVSVAADMQPNQDPVETVTDTTQLAVFVSNYAGIINYKLSAPSSSADLLLSNEPFYAFLTRALMDVAIYPDMFLSVAAFSSNPYGTAVLPSLYNASSAVQKVVVGPADGSSGYNLLYYDIEAVLQHIYSDGFQEFNDHVLNTTLVCYLGERNVVKNFTCPWGVYSFTCNGNASLVHTSCYRRGERHRYCGSFDTSMGRFVSSACKLTNSSAGESTCLCRLNSTAYISGDIGAIDLIAMSEFLVTSHESVVFEYVNVKYQVFNREYSVLITYLVILFASVMALFSYMNLYKAAELLPNVQDKADQLKSEISSFSINRTHISDFLELYVSTLFSSVYAFRLSSLDKIAFEMREHHKWFKLFSVKHTKKSVLVYGSRLITSMALTMFIVLVSFALQATEDSTCHTNYSADDCESEKTLFDGRLSSCVWKDFPEDDTPRCSFQNPVVTAQVYIVITAILLILHAPIELFMDWLFDDVILSPKDEEKLRTYRESLTDPEDIRSFDFEWGLLHVSQAGTPRVVSELCKGEMAAVARFTLEKLNLVSSLSVEDVGYEILITFLQDLLGRDSEEARVVMSRVNRDLKPKRAYSKWIQYAAIAFVFLLNCFFMVYTITRGSMKDYDFQVLWLVLVITEILADVVIVESVRILVVDQFLPSFFLREIVSLMDTVEACLRDLSSSYGPSLDNELSAPEYFFASNALARAYPSLMESRIVLAYRSHTPGMVGRKWNTVYDITGRTFFSRLNKVVNSNFAAFCGLPWRLQYSICSWILAGLIISLYLFFDQFLGYLIKRTNWGPIFIGVVFGVIFLLIVVRIALNIMGKRERARLRHFRSDSREQIEKMDNERRAVEAGNGASFRARLEEGERVRSPVEVLKSDSLVALSTSSRVGNEGGVGGLETRSRNSSGSKDGAKVVSEESIPVGRGGSGVSGNGSGFSRVVIPLIEDDDGEGMVEAFYSPEDPPFHKHPVDKGSSYDII
eukprot:gene1555-1800_t